MSLRVVPSTALLLLLCVASSLPTNISRIHAQQPTVPQKHLGTDLVRLRDGTRLLGFVIGHNASGAITLAVERKWLQASYPELADSAAKQEREQSAAALKALQDRIETWRAERDQDEVLASALDRQLEDLRNRKTDKSPPTRFATLTFTAQQVASKTMASQKNRQIAGVVFQQGLQDVTTSSAILLERKLTDRGIDATKTLVDLTSELASHHAESDEDWRVRQALFEYHYREPLEYQGTGTKFYKSGDDQDIMQVAADLMGGGNSIAQLGAELGLPEFKQFAKQSDSQWWKETCEQAEADGFCGVLIKRLESQALSGAATVSVHFFAKQSAGQWKPAFRTTVVKRLSEVKQDQLDRLKEDPQVQKITQMTSSLGLSLGDKLDTALRTGAATQLALEEASAAFQRHLVRYIDRLDTPPMVNVSQ